MQVGSLQSGLEVALNRIAELENIHRNSSAVATSKVFREPKNGQTADNLIRCDPGPGEGGDGGEGDDGGPSPLHTASTPLLQYHRNEKRYARSLYSKFQI